MSDMIPARTFTTDKGVWSIYDNGLRSWFNHVRAGISRKKLPLPVVTYHSSDTNVTISSLLANRYKRVASYKAWASARESRSPGELLDILTEMEGRGVDPDKKLDETFRNYGHRSPSDIAELTIHFRGTPMFVPLMVFNQSAEFQGQENSTRYQKQYAEATLHDLRHYLPDAPLVLRNMHSDLGKLSLQNYNDEKPVITRAYIDFYKPTTKAEMDSLDSRVLDTIRYYLLLGQYTGFSIRDTVGNFNKLIAATTASPSAYLREFGHQLHDFLAPEIIVEKKLDFLAEAREQIRHTEADHTTTAALNRVEEFLKDKSNKFDSCALGIAGLMYNPLGVKLIPRKYTEGDRVAARYIWTLHPGINTLNVLEYVHNLPVDSQKKLSDCIADGYDRHHEMPKSLAATTSMSVVIEGTLGELRDFNRHRPWSRFMKHVPILYRDKITYDVAMQVLDTGHGLPLYVTEILEFKKLGLMMRDRLYRYHESAVKFMHAVHREYGDRISYDFVFTILPLAQRSDLVMDGNPAQENYLTDLRVRNGAHINCRVTAFDIANLVSNSEPLLHGFRLDCPKPDPANRKEFFDRS